MPRGRPAQKTDDGSKADGESDIKGKAQPKGKNKRGAAEVKPAVSKKQRVAAGAAADAADLITTYSTDDAPKALALDMASEQTNDFDNAATVLKCPDCHDCKITHLLQQILDEAKLVNQREPQKKGGNGRDGLGGA